MGMRQGGRGAGVPGRRVAAALRRAAAIAAVLLGSSLTQAATLTVMNNNDSGAGSLRATVAAAAPGDTIVFGTVTGTIPLTSGAIAINQNLTINGPGRARSPCRAATAARFST